MVSRDSGKPGVYIEFVRQGRVVKVTAIDERTGVEASIIGPSNAPQGALEVAAARKLEYLLKKKSGG